MNSILCIHFWIVKMPKSNSFTWNQIHSKLSFRSLNSCVGCTSRYLESLCVQFKVMDQRLHWWLKKKIEWRLNFTGDWQNKTAKYIRPISCANNDKSQRFMTIWHLPDICLTSSWHLPDICLTTVWLPDDCLITSWRPVSSVR